MEYVLCIVTMRCNICYVAFLQFKYYGFCCRLVLLVVVRAGTISCNNFTIDYKITLKTVIRWSQCSPSKTIYTIIRTSKQPVWRVVSFSHVQDDLVEYNNRFWLQISYVWSEVDMKCHFLCVISTTAFTVLLCNGKKIKYFLNSIELLHNFHTVKFKSFF